MEASNTSHNVLSTGDDERENQEQEDALERESVSLSGSVCLFLTMPTPHLLNDLIILGWLVGWLVSLCFPGWP